jgi:gamma-glutamylcysteine synthetase
VSGRGPQTPELEAEVSSAEQLVAHLRTGEKPEASWRVGTEHEKIGLREADLAPVPYEGERGIRALLEAIADADGWARVLEAGNSPELRCARSTRPATSSTRIWR